MKDLHDLLDTATNRVGNPDLIDTVLRSARRRRRTHRSLTVIAVALALIVGGTVIEQLVKDSTDSAPVVPPPEVPTTNWSPRAVDHLPPASPDLARELPRVVEPPGTASALTASPVPAAVLSIRADDAVLVLTTDGDWRSVPPPSDGAYGAALSADGTRLAIDADTGVDVWTLPTGQRQSVAYPPTWKGPDLGSWMWIDDAHLLFDDPEPGGSLVDVDTGDVTRVPYPTDHIAVTIDPAGGVIESTDFGLKAQLIDWTGGDPRRLDLDRLGRLTSLAANSDLVVGVAGTSIAAVDRTDLTPIRRLNLIDADNNFGDGKMPVVAVSDNGTALLQVPVLGPQLSWRIVAWNTDTGELTMLTRGTGPVPASYASEILN